MAKAKQKMAVALCLAVMMACLGCDESSSPRQLPASVPPPIAGDINNDGIVDNTDLFIVKANWGKSPASRIDGDLNGNNVVDGPDYAEVLSNWAPESVFLCRMCWKIDPRSKQPHTVGPPVRENHNCDVCDRPTLYWGEVTFTKGGER